jgi:hypothetical protein
MQACLEMCINNVGAKGFVNTSTTVVLSLRARIITKRPLNIVLQQGVFLLKAMPLFFFFLSGCSLFTIGKSLCSYLIRKKTRIKKIRVGWD